MIVFWSQTDMLQKHWQMLVLWGIALALLLVPIAFWGSLYAVGGDDARLYYLYPRQYLENFSFNVISNNTLGANQGYMPVSFSVPIIGFLFLIKYILPFLHTQFVAYGFILSFGFIFFYKFLREIVPEKSPWHFISRATASLFYILSPYITRTYFQHQVISIFLLAVVPGCLFLFVAGVKRKQARFVIASALLYSLFSSTLYSIPWFLPVVLVLLPFLVLLIRQEGTYVWKGLAMFLGVTVLCNFYWIIHLLIPLFYNTGETPLTASLTSGTFQKQNMDLIYALVHLNSPVNQMINHLRTGWVDRFGVTVGQSIGGLYLLIILFAGTLLTKAKKNTRSLYVIAITVLLLAMLFITPNFGAWNLALFQFFNDHVPFFGMFRNMYDKFALAMAFGYAFALFIALVVIGEAKVRYRYVLPAVVFLLIIATAFPYLVPSYKDNQYSTRISGQMNREFIDLAEYLKNLDTTSRFVWLPMTFPGYVYIEDEANPNHFYAGLSPLQLLSQKSDIAGFYGIQTPQDPLLNWKILELFKNRSYEDIVRILANQNIGYVIVNHDSVPQPGYGFLNNFDFMALQTEEYRETILGEKIRDFGSRYSLYTINEKFFLPTVSGADTFQKLPDGSYEITVLDVPTQLTLREPYNRLWNIGKFPPPQPTADGFGNVWQIDAPGTYRIEFWPRKL